jgi:carbamoyltransferase
MYILGLNAYHPDSSACIIKDGQLIAAAEEERFSRIKHWAGFPKESIRYCLRQADIGLVDINYIALNRNPRANIYKKIAFVLLHNPSVALIRNRLSNILKIKVIKETLCKEFRISRRALKAKIVNIEHHRAHLASAFFVSPFEKAAVVSFDGFGDFTSCMMARGIDNRLAVLDTVYFPHSLGLFYTAFTQYLGFGKYGDEYKVMGLAAYGKPAYIDRLEKILLLKPAGFALNLRFFSFYKTRNLMLWNNTEPVLGNVYSKKMVKNFGPARKPEEEITAYHCDLAASVQAMYEKAFFHILNYIHDITGITNLCLAGGCALNSVANAKIFDKTSFKELYIQPGSSDAGGSLGAAYYLYHQILHNKREFIMKDAFWGPDFVENDYAEAIREHMIELEERNCTIDKVEEAGDLLRITAELIAQGKIVGWFQGRMEWGPRALGNRSILADPRKPENKEILNQRVKKREEFRPFALSVLLERASEYFDKYYPDPFMISVYPVKEKKRSLIPAVIHVDGTARIQTVSEEANPLFWRLLKEFEKLTGVGVLLNTSFNENEPIVCRPQEAVECFLRTKMDVLIMGDYLIKKSVTE